MVGLAVGGPLALILFLVVILGGGAGAGSSVGNLTSGLQAGAALNAGVIPNQAWVPWIEKAGGLCPTFPAPVIAAQIQAESGWNPNAVSPTGAQGLSQFEPGTWPAYSNNVAGDGNVSPFNPPDAIMAQGRYDCALATAVDGLSKSTGIPVVTLALDGYNAGLGAVSAAGGIPHNSQTEAYAPEIEALAGQYSGLTLISAVSGQLAQGELAAASAEIGRPYVWGGGTPLGPSGSAVAPPGLVGQPGFDCSGLVLYAIFQASGGTVQLPHSSETQATMGQNVATGPGSAVLGSGLLQPGDVIAFQLGTPGDYDHIGIYAGNGTMIVAPQTGGQVDLENLNTPYWLGVPWSARRFG
ncbi:MAG: bifunctional lytic transglycosylase/C40 family peptidase [Actinomycetota bacterium]|nr:bifunctional lytic transglycosylase/C40 family peptidase [Actinomycetota bacterium]